MVEALEKAFEGSAHTEVAPAVCDVDERVTKARNHRIDTLLHIGTLHNAGSHGFFGPLLGESGIHLDDVHRHTELDGVGQTPVAFHRSNACEQVARGLVIGEEDVVDDSLVPTRAHTFVTLGYFLFVELEAGHDAVEVFYDVGVDFLHGVVLGGVFRVQEVFAIGKGTGEVGLLLSSEGDVEEIDGLDFGNGINGGVVQDGHDGVLDHGIAAEGVAIKFARNVVGGCQRTIHEVLVRYNEILRIGIGAEAVLALVGVCLGHLSVLCAAQTILARDALSEVGALFKGVHASHYFLLGEEAAIAERVGVAVVYGGFGGGLVNAKLCSRVVVVQAGLHAERCYSQCTEKKYLFHKDVLFWGRPVLLDFLEVLEVLDFLDFLDFLEILELLVTSRSVGFA